MVFQLTLKVFVLTKRQLVSGSGHENLQLLLHYLDVIYSLLCGQLDDCFVCFVHDNSYQFPFTSEVRYTR